MRDRPPDRFMSRDGRSGWYAFPPAGDRPDQDDRREGPPEGALIRFMSEDTVDIPLWSEDGLLFANGDELVREWGVTQDLAADIVRWGRSSQGPPSAELDAEAARLIRRLRRELDDRFRIVYWP